jgi:hypothetical protein
MYTTQTTIRVPHKVHDRGARQARSDALAAMVRTFGRSLRESLLSCARDLRIKT